MAVSRFIGDDPLFAQVSGLNRDNFIFLHHSIVTQLKGFGLLFIL